MEDRIRQPVEAILFQPKPRFLDAFARPNEAEFKFLAWPIHLLLAAVSPVCGTLHIRLITWINPNSSHDGPAGPPLRRPYRRQSGRAYQRRDRRRYCVTCAPNVRNPLTLSSNKLNPRTGGNQPYRNPFEERHNQRSHLVRTGQNLPEHDLADSTSDRQQPQFTASKPNRLIIQYTTQRIGNPAVCRSISHAPPPRG
jgi:hypothetical protein